MSRIVYYLGAGASFGKRDSSGTILEGVPVVAEIPAQFDTFCDYISNASIPSNSEIIFQDMYRVSSGMVEQERRDMLSDIQFFKSGIRAHFTIDTYAKKLYLTHDIANFEKLKRVLCAFLIWEQVEHTIDSRYDSFLANILESKTNLSLPKDISIISWNYDSQIELAYRAFDPNRYLPIFEKNIQGTLPTIPDGGRVFKVNGSATYADKSVVMTLLKENDAGKRIAQFVEYYGSVKSDTSEFGFQNKTHLSFAWEESASDKMMGSLYETLSDTQVVVVIGYSFPFFNRRIDREIFNAMGSLKTIYVQDINPSSVIQTIDAVLPDINIRKVPISDCTQFYLPPEL